MQLAVRLLPLRCLMQIARSWRRLLAGVTVTGLTTTTDLTATGTTTLAGASTTANITFGDNDKAIFGAGSDLQIYHDGSHSYIKDNGTGDLILQGSDQVKIQTITGETMVSTNENNAVVLYYDNASKLATTSTGIDVTGTVTASSAVNAVGFQDTQSTSGFGYLNFGDTDDANIGQIGYDHTSNYMRFQVNNAERLRIDSSGNVGIGTTSPATQDISANNLVVEDGAGNGGITIKTPSNAYGSLHFSDGTGADAYRGILAYNHSDNSMQFYTNTSEAMRINSSGKVGIGTTSPTRALHVNSGAANEVARFESTDTEALIELVDTTGSAQIRSRNDLRFYTNGGSTRAMDIDSSGNVGIGTSSPDASSGLTVESSTTSGQIMIKGSSGGNAGIALRASGQTTNFSIYENSGANLVFQKHATERMRITSSGRVGIGTSSPTGNANGSALVLEVHSSGANPPEILAGGQNAEISIAGGVAASYLWSTGAYPLIMATNATERMRITSSGNVGIGTSSPNAPTAIVANTTTYEGLELVTPTGDGSGEFHIGVHDNGGTGGRNIVFKRGGSDGMDTESMRIDSSGKVGIGTSSPTTALHVLSGTANSDVAIFSGSNAARGLKISTLQGGAGDEGVDFDAHASATGFHTFSINGTERIRLDASGNLLVGTTSSTIYGGTTTGINLNPDGPTSFNRASGQAAMFNRISTDGDIVQFRKDGNTVGSIGVASTSFLTIGGTSANHGGLRFDIHAVLPMEAGTQSDNTIDLGSGSYRYDDVFATNGTIQTSDRNEKQDIEALSDAEQRVAVACKGLLRKFRWKDAVAEKGDDARIHFGIIAQDLQDAFAAEGLDAGDYAMFISSTWWEATETYTDDDGVEQTRVNTYETAEEAPEGATERTRLGVRYPELLAFIIAAI